MQLSVINVKMTSYNESFSEKIFSHWEWHLCCVFLYKNYSLNNSKKGGNYGTHNKK
jgi:hypothetical protein